MLPSACGAANLWRQAGFLPALLAFFSKPPRKGEKSLVGQALSPVEQLFQPRRALLVLLIAPILCAQQFDVLIANGKIVDGAGGPWYYADVAIKGDTIAAIGHFDPKTAARTIDAKGMVVAPGFIDIHTHARRGIFIDPSAQNYIRQGVTTLMEGNDGSSPLPIGKFLAEVAGTHPAPNFGTFAGQGSIRSAVMQLVNRPATPEEIEKMRVLMRQAMLDGAFGMSTGLFYVPGNFTPPDEVIEVAKIAGAMGGMHISHMRNESAQILDSVKETIRIGEEGHMPTQVTHHKIIGGANWASANKPFSW